jgi:hypothetical protein
LSSKSQENSKICLKHTIRDEPIKENKAFLEKINSFPKEDEKHKEFKKIEIENGNLIQKVSWKENWTLVFCVLRK